MTKYMIKAEGQTRAWPAAPTPGKWYCGFDIVSDMDNNEYHRERLLARFIEDCGAVCFVDEGGEIVDMGTYDYLVEQL